MLIQGIAGVSTKQAKKMLVAALAATDSNTTIKEIENAPEGVLVEMLGDVRVLDAKN